MENIENYKKESDPVTAEKINFKYSPELEIEIIKYTLKKYSWFKENKYKINLPKSIKDKAEKGETIADEEILDAIKLEFDDNEYAKKIEKITEKWDKIQDRFIKDLISLGGPIIDEYDVQLTKYGVAGSYRLPDYFVVNIDSGDLMTIPHEMIHLSIERWILDNKISHWVKERLVDLVMGKFFPERARFQRDPENKDEIEKIFNSNFPDMHKIIQEVSRLRKE